MTEPVLIMLNLGLCMFGGWICICRMRFMGSDTKPMIRTQYVVWFTTFAFSGLSWLFEMPANGPQLVFGGVVVLHFLLGRGAWAAGAPSYSRLRRPVSLGEELSRTGTWSR